jgi:hypothetical protein
MMFKLQLGPGLRLDQARRDGFASSMFKFSLASWTWPGLPDLGRSLATAAGAAPRAVELAD